MASEQTLLPTNNHPTPVNHFYSRVSQVMDVPNLIEVQSGLLPLVPGRGHQAATGRDFPHQGLHRQPPGAQLSSATSSASRAYSEQECRQRDLTYSVPLYVRARLLVKETGEIKEQDLFFGDIPLMTAKGTFITSGAERVVVSQLLRSPGVYFTAEEDPTSGRQLCYAKLIPTRGAWLEFETSNRDVISVKIDGKRKIPITTLLRAIGYGSDDELLDLFAEEDNNPDHQYIKSTMERDPRIKDESDALMDIYQQAAPRRPAQPGKRPQADQQPVLQPAALRPGRRSAATS